MDAAIRVTFSTDSSSPPEIRSPSPAKGRTMIPAASNVAAASRVCSPVASQTKFPCAAGTYTVTATSYWTINWSGIGESGVINQTYTSSVVVTIGELQTVVKG